MDWKRFPRTVLVSWLLGVALLLCAAAAGTLVVNLMRLRDSFSWVQRTNDVLLTISAVQQSILQAEASERGFLLTGIGNYRDSYSQARDQLPSLFDSLRASLSDNPAQIKNLGELQLLTGMRTAQLDRVVELGQSGIADALEILEQARIDHLTERVEASVQAMVRVEQFLLRERMARHNHASRLAALITVCLLILAVGSAAVAAFLVEHQRGVARQQNADRRLQGLQVELMRVARLSTMGEMSSALAHELNQPLAAATNFVQGSRRLVEASSHPDKAKITSALDKAAQQTLRAGAVIQRMREFLGRGETDKTDESLRAIAEDACALASVVTLDYPVDVRIDVDPIHDRVLVDKVQVQQVFLNLFRNAFEAMRDQPERRLGVTSRTADNDMIEVAIEDSGPGLDATMIDRIFQPFATTKSNGMGIGLSISQTIIQAHGGSIWVKPAVQGGTIFCFTLPMAPLSRQTKEWK